VADCNLVMQTDANVVLQLHEKRFLRRPLSQLPFLISLIHASEEGDTALIFPIHIFLSDIYLKKISTVHCY